MGTFATKLSLYKVTGKDAEGKEIKVKSGETKPVQIEEPEWTQSPEAMLAKFKDVPGIKEICRKYFVKSVIVDIQSYLRRNVVEAEWNVAGLTKAMNAWRPSAGRTKKSKEERAAQELGMSLEDLNKMIADNMAKKAKEKGAQE